MRVDDLHGCVEGEWLVCWGLMGMKLLLEVSKREVGEGAWMGGWGLLWWGLWMWSILAGEGGVSEYRSREQWDRPVSCCGLWQRLSRAINISADDAYYAWVLLLFVLVIKNFTSLLFLSLLLLQCIYSWIYLIFHFYFIYLLFLFLRSAGNGSALA